jgi:hypothetical protein
MWGPLFAKFQQSCIGGTVEVVELIVLSEIEGGRPPEITGSE